MSDTPLRLAQAAAHLGVHPLTLRRWANEGKVNCLRVGSERRFLPSELDRICGVIPGGAEAAPQTHALYLRVSSSSGQETSLLAQEAELRVAAKGHPVRVFKDKSSGLRERRPGLDRLLAAARAGEIAVVHVTHEDRLARFGAMWLRDLLDRDGVAVQVMHAKGGAGGMEELMADFMSLVTTFAGRMYGIRGRDARRRLLIQADASLGSLPAGALPSAPSKISLVALNEGGDQRG